MRFFVMRNKDAANAYVGALLSAGHIETRLLRFAHFLLYDVERPGKRFETYQCFLSEHPGFIYPHTPYSSYFTWDGIYQPLPVKCNFVVGPGAKRALQAIKYPYRVEVVGFGHCKVLPFRPNSGRRVLFFVPRPQHGMYTARELYAGLVRVNDWLIDNRREFEHVTIAHTVDYWKALGLKICNDFMYVSNNPRKDPSPSRWCVSLIDNHDLVFGIATAAYLALARGKPTIMWGNDLHPRTIGHLAAQPELYMDYFRYPLDFGKMSMDDILTTTQIESDVVKKWKIDNIGKNFNQKKFLDIIAECL